VRTLGRDLITDGVASRERDIGVVLVAGAGASCAFGVNGKPMPLMGDWSLPDLMRHLARGAVPSECANAFPAPAR
jgi:hypothetical protein